MMEVIVKYPNRKFYSKLQKKHVAMVDIFLAYKDGKKIKVETYGKKEDITYRTLMQCYAYFADETDCKYLLKSQFFYKNF